MTQQLYSNSKPLKFGGRYLGGWFHARSVEKQHRIGEKSRWIVLILVVNFLCVTGVSLLGSRLVADDEFAKKSTWENLPVEKVTQQVKAWISENSPDELMLAKAEALWAVQPENKLAVLSLFGETAGLFYPKLQPLNTQDQLSKNAGNSIADLGKVLDDESIPSFVRANVRLVWARSLAQQSFYDEALEQLDLLEPEEVLDPATLLFYKGICQQRLLQKEDALKSLQRLSENSATLPIRYRQIAELMIKDLEPLKADSLDEISRIMEDIRRRQKLYRSGKKVIKQEEDVIAKLDKMIDDLEKKKQKQKSKSGSAPGGNPLEDSIPAGGINGKGEVAPRQLGEGGSWGDLPPKKRAAIMANLVKDLPPHYREVIQEYFRKLASQDKSN